MAKPNFIELGGGKWTERIPILYEDRSVLAIDKPAGWMLVPFSWQRTERNLQAAIVSSIAAGDFWARSRNLKFLRNVHRLDAETSGVLLMARSPGAVDTFGDLFESRAMDKTYLAVARGIPKQTQWTCRQKIAPDPQQFGKMKVDQSRGKDSETQFRVLETCGAVTLIEAKPLTGRTHQIRIHFLESGHPVLGDLLYGRAAAGETRTTRREKEFPLALRAVELAYVDPFTHRPVRISAPREPFLRAFGFAQQQAGKTEAREAAGLDPREENRG